MKLFCSYAYRPNAQCVKFATLQVIGLRQKLIGLHNLHQMLSVNIFSEHSATQVNKIRIRHSNHGTLNRIANFFVIESNTDPSCMLVANRIPMTLDRISRCLESRFKSNHNSDLSVIGLAQCDFRFDLFFSFSFSFANNQIISNLLTKTC